MPYSIRYVRRRAVDVVSLRKSMQALIDLKHWHVRLASKNQSRFITGRV